MRVEWDSLIKPVFYTWELILTAVVTFGTADQLLFSIIEEDGTAGRVKCAFNGKLSICIVVITMGTMCFLVTFAVLWRRLVAAFTPATFPKVDESGLCCLLIIAWVIIASVISANLSPPENDGTKEVRFAGMRSVVTTFAWLNVFSFMVSAAIAAYKPDGEDARLHYQMAPPAPLDGTTRRSIERLADEANNKLDGGVDSRVADSDLDEHLEALHLRRVEDKDFHKGSGIQGALDAHVELPQKEQGPEEENPSIQPGQSPHGIRRRQTAARHTAPGATSSKV